MTSRLIWAWALALAVLALCSHDATAFGRRGSRCQPCYRVYCPPMQYYCPPVPLHCPSVPTPNDSDDNDPDMPSAPAKVPNVPAITNDAEPEETPNLRLFNDTTETQTP